MPKSTTLPRRSKKYGVGKEISGAVYLHRQYEELLGEPVQTAKTYLPPEFEYTVVKYAARTGSVTFIHSPDFDTAAEPIVGDSILVDGNGRTRRRTRARDPEIYHHKWLFVADDYGGFDVEAAKRRSAACMQLAELDVRRIGRRSYWQEHVVSRLEEG